MLGAEIGTLLKFPIGQCVLLILMIQSLIRKGFKELILSQYYRNNLIEKGSENVDKFKPDAIANQYYKIYKSIAQSK